MSRSVKGYLSFFFFFLCSFSWPQIVGYSGVFLNAFLQRSRIFTSRTHGAGTDNKHASIIIRQPRHFILDWPISSRPFTKGINEIPSTTRKKGLSSFQKGMNECVYITVKVQCPQNAFPGMDGVQKSDNSQTHNSPPCLPPCSGTPTIPILKSAPSPPRSLNPAFTINATTNPAQRIVGPHFS